MSLSNVNALLCLLVLGVIYDDLSTKRIGSTALNGGNFAAKRLRLSLKVDSHMMRRGMMRRGKMRQKRMIVIHTCSVSSFKK